MRCWPGALLLLSVTAVLPAQGGGAEPVDTAAELARMNRSLTQNRSEVERLLDLRIRHDLGLPMEQDATSFTPAGPVTTESLERARRELRDQDAVTTTLAERYRKLKSSVEQLRADAEAQHKSAGEQHEFVTVPSPGSAATGGAGANGRGAAREPQPTLPPVPPTAQESRPAPVEAVAFHGLDPIRGQIHGSEDHQRVAQALFKAGQDLMDRAAMLRLQDQSAAADELDHRAKERLVRALEELEPLLAKSEPPFPALFYKGRCLELLFRYSERHEDLSITKSTREFQRREQEVRDAFLRISARDVTKTGERGNVEVLGPWGLAAQTAMEHFRWMNLHSGYKPLVPIDSLTWPGEKEL
ncbi:MAG: hypothetical protein H6838_01710 [Planctomycetes bacterium]|nr:hypothetical protein [Planctomycetota bacterium]MCB9884174.1 hypothetical protein [Planctomycetota bacterium]